MPLVSVCITPPYPDAPPAPPLVGAFGRYRAGALSASDGDLISSLPDELGISGALTASGSLRPTYKAAILGTEPVLRFAGGQALVAAFDSTHTQPFSVAVVTSIGGDGKYVADTNDSGGANRWILTQGVFIGNQLSAYAGDYSHTSFAQTPPVAAAQYLAIFNGSSSSIWKGGTSQASGDAGSNSAGGVTIGARFSVEDFLSGDLAEMLFYDHALDSTERTALATYFTTKYGV